VRIGVIRSGGQTGVDRAALDFAREREIRYAGWCPRGGWAEDHPAPPGVLALYSGLSETPSDIPAQRTAWNVRDSHATLILVQGENPGSSQGTIFTQQAAELIFLRPCLVIDIAASDAAGTAYRWLDRVASVLSCDMLVLNVAGPRESEIPGIYAAARQFLDKLFRIG